jgi:hypothetical protein
MAGIFQSLPNREVTTEQLSGLRTSLKDVGPGKPPLGDVTAAAAAPGVHGDTGASQQPPHHEPVWQQG